MVNSEDHSNGVLLEEQTVLTLDELGRACAIHREMVLSLVEEGIIEPLEKDHEHWHFAADSLQRVRAVLRLQEDLGINLAGAALALELLDEIETLRAQLDAFLARKPQE